VSFRKRALSKSWLPESPSACYPILVECRLGRRLAGPLGWLIPSSIQWPKAGNQPSAMSSEFDTSSPRRFETSRWRDSLTWSALIIIGFLIYELTTQPILGVIVACSKFAWNDFLIAFLLRSVDHNPRRRRALFWVFVAGGLSNVTYVSVSLVLIIFLIMVPFGPAGFQGALVRAISAFAVLFLCYFLITLAVSRGVYLAAKSQTKVWLPPRSIFAGTYQIHWRS
jgi:hypothetical protein